MSLSTFLTVLSGSSAISGTFASTISENRFRIKLADLWNRKQRRCVNLMTHGVFSNDSNDPAT